MKKIIIALSIFLLASGPVISALEDDIGVTGAPFLKIPTSSRLISRGEAFNAMVNDPTAVSINVAGLANINNFELLFSHYEWFLDLDYEHLAFAKPVKQPKGDGAFGGIGVLGFGITYLHAPLFPEYGSWGEIVSEINYSDLAFTTAYAQKFHSFDVGLSFKIIRQEVAQLTEFAFASDFGVIYSQKLPKNFLWLPNTYGKVVKFALVANNIGYERFGLGDGIRGANLPTIFKFGIGTEIMNDLEFEFDVEQPMDNQIRLNTGLELNIRNYVFLRGGYRFLGYDDVDTFTLGLGVKYPFGTKIVKVDAAYAPGGPMQGTANLTFGVSFPGVSSDEDWKMANMLYYKGIYYYTNGELEKAIELWEEVLKYRSDHPKAKQKIKDAKYLLELKKIEEKVEGEFGEL